LETVELKTPNADPAAVVARVLSCKISAIFESDENGPLQRSGRFEENGI
jgi:hypothetical protein